MNTNKIFVGLPCSVYCNGAVAPSGLIEILAGSVRYFAKSTHFASHFVRRRGKFIRIR